MKICWDPDAWADYLYWQETTPANVANINELIKEIRRTPFKGTGKPEPLKENLSGWWSRRITGDHRLVYRVSGKPAERDRPSDQRLEIIACRYHY